MLQQLKRSMSHPRPLGVEHVIYENCDVIDTGRPINWTTYIHIDIRFDEKDFSSLAWRDWGRQERGAGGLPEGVRTTKRELTRGVSLCRGGTSAAAG